MLDIIKPSLDMLCLSLDMSSNLSRYLAHSTLDTIATNQQGKQGEEESGGSTRAISDTSYAISGNQVQ